MPGRREQPSRPDVEQPDVERLGARLLPRRVAVLQRDVAAAADRRRRGPAPAACPAGGRGARRRSRCRAASARPPGRRARASSRRREHAAAGPLHGPPGLGIDDAGAVDDEAELPARGSLVVAHGNGRARRSTRPPSATRRTVHRLRSTAARIQADRPSAAGHASTPLPSGAAREPRTPKSSPVARCTTIPPRPPTPTTHRTPPQSRMPATASTRPRVDVEDERSRVRDEQAQARRGAERPPGDGARIGRSCRGTGREHGDDGCDECGCTLHGTASTPRRRPQFRGGYGPNESKLGGDESTGVERLLCGTATATVPEQVPPLPSIAVKAMR